MYTDRNVKKAKERTETLSYWKDSIGSELIFKNLDKDIKTDVVIVGGGIAGLSIAYNLIQSGKKVAIVEDGSIGSGETGHTTAHLVTALDDRYYELEDVYGRENVKRIAESHAAAIDFVEATIKEESIDCEFDRVDGYLFLHPSDKPESLDKELKAAQNAMLSVEKLDHVPGMIKEEGPCIRFSKQAQFHPLKYLKGLCRAIEKKGGLIFTNTHADKIDSTGITSTEGYKIEADHVVVATNSPVNNKYTTHLKQFPYRTYVIGATIKKGSVPKALWWDTGDFLENAKIPPYHYVRIQAYDDEHDLLICGGEDHPTGVPEIEVIPVENNFLLLESWARQRFPLQKVIYEWSGQVLEPSDSLAYIGKNPWDKKNMYIATGDSGNGITHGTIAGMLISDLINEKENKWQDIYEPSRIHFFSTGITLMEENIKGLVAYLRNNPEGEVPLDIQKGKDGQVIQRQGKKYGVYIDESDFLHMVSATCTHLGCTVKWNTVEKSWDCACHGSRYTYEGKVLNGPTNKDLSHHKVFYKE